MTETVVHVTTLEQWKSVLDVWFKQGYKWNSGDTEYSGHLFTGHKYLVLQFFEGSSYIHCTDEVGKSIEYSDFMAQQKEDKEVKTYYVAQEQLDLIKYLKSRMFPMSNLIDNQDNRCDSLMSGITPDEELSILRYLGGDEMVEFKVKEQLYRLWRMETNDRIYMRINDFGTPIWTVHKDNAYTAPLEEITKWQTPAWEIEDVD